MRHMIWSILLLTLLCGVCSAATLSVDPAESTCASGETVDLTVWVKDVSNLGGFDFDLKWDPRVVRLNGTNVDDSIIKGPHVDSIMVNSQSGRARIAGISALGITRGADGADLFAVRFVGVDDTGASTPVTLTVNNYGFLNSTSGEEIPVAAITNATITAEKTNVVDARIAVPSNQVITGLESRLTASVVNRRGAVTSPLDVNVSIVDGSGAMVESWLYPGETVPAWGRFQRELAWTPAAPGTYSVRINVTSDKPVSGTTDYTTTITAKEYTLEFTDGYVYGPWDGRASAGSWFSMGAYVRASQPGNVRFNITAPDHVEVDGGRNQTRYLYGYDWNYVGVWMRSNTPGRIAAGDIKFDIAANGKADSVDCPTVLIWIPSIQVSSVNVTSVTGTPGELTFNTLHTNNTYDNVTKLTIQSGARGRTLSGLDYLVGYPYGCVEQTTSRMMASLNVKNYYLDRAERPTNWDSIRENVNSSISGGVQKLVRGGEVGQNSDGGWNLWGGDPSESSSSSYASYTLARINMPEEDLNRLLDGKISNGSTVTSGTVNFEKLIQWFHDNPDNPSSGTWTWSAHVCHSWTPESNTAFVMLIHDMINQTVELDAEHRGYMEDNMRNATRYFVDTQKPDGSWSTGDDQAMATALALWGLESFALPSDDVTDQQIADAKAAAAEWLIASQNSDGSWPVGGYYGWYYGGRDAEATGYAVLALNATGLTADNPTISSGVNWLIEQYETGGGWGYTWATQVAIDALIQCQPNIITTGTVDVVIDGASIGTFSVDATNPRTTYTLTPAQMDVLMAGGNLKRDIFGDGFSTVKSHLLTATLTAGSGPILVSVDHTQYAPTSEIDNTIRSNPVIQSFGYDEEEAGLLQVSTDIGTLADLEEENPYTVGITSTPMVAGEEADLTITVTSSKNVYSPMIEVPISGFSFDNASTIFENGTAGAFEVLNSTTSSDQLALFIQSVGWVRNVEMTYRFTIIPKTHGDLDVDLRIRPLYDETQVTFASETIRVMGKGNVTVNVVDENGASVTADSIALGATSVADKSSHTFTSVLQGTYPLVVNSTGYPSIHTAARVAPGATGIYNVTLPSSLADPTLVLSEGGAGSIADVARVPPEPLNALRNENTTYSVTVLGNGGELGLALEFPMRYLMNNPVVKVNGVVTPYELINGTFEYNPLTRTYSTTNATLVVYNTTAGSNTIDIEFDGGRLGKARRTGEVTSTDAMFVLQFVVGSRAGFDTYDYVDVHSRDRQMITSTDAMYILQKVTGSRDEYYNLKS
ncbi:hypothetical protein F8E02_05655 [Methanoculleus sp. Wushi-C6]|uniref:Squalene cyclase C-terminal domain-containing protein n=1 Tax=Methanoculleus caldifontis TaxID=2651577 RepID=A0ABU3X0B5_9EURY|nr:hypothetical protein [Methanoculleus sp. Wushi-C6]MDV2481498.1 hypothetical protein [Methanoculleus sp. Wushi-C6]